MKTCNEILQESTAKGLRVDVESLAVRINAHSESVLKFGEALSKVAPGMRPSSTQEIGKYLFQTLGYESLKKTINGKDCVDLETLNKIYAKTHDESVKMILDVRKEIKVLGQLKRMMKDVKAGRVHVEFTDDCSSGRIYSKNPSLQTFSKECRECVIPDDGNSFVGADYCQQELQIMAVASQDKNLLKLLDSGEDLHTAVAKEALGKNTISPEERMFGKVLNYGIPYGMEKDGLAGRLGCSREAAEMMLGRYWLKFPELHSWLESAKDFAEKNGFTTTLLSGKVCGVQHKSSAGLEYKKDIRRCVNHILQGTAADILKILVEKIEIAFPGSLRMVIHDAVLVECRFDQVSMVSQKLEELMEEAGREFNLRAVVKFGQSWAQLHEEVADVEDAE